ncbi:hypothetical protein KO516_09010 [Citreicella sp. C3M06]|uniref:ATP-grasp domain-containing protein n=1 Tax=Citreicella sp. C3M06 TaxID=2841564 RepID=UPI001C0A06C3|nr:hypothetical protein [Citreicella sp. C3M06]MBU2960951.1 hypothetical protein [Citreicella sp. C3M06]
MELQNRVGIAQLTTLALQGVDLHPLRSHLLRKCAEDQDQAGALMDLSVIDQLYGDLEQGLAWQARAISACQLYRTDRGRKGKKTLLVFALPVDIGSNTPIEFLVPSADYEIITCYLDPDADQAFLLPDHDVAFCAAPADSRDAVRFSAAIRRAFGAAEPRVLNLLDASVRIDRISLQHQVPQTAGLVLPRVIETSRKALQGAQRESAIAQLGGYPVIIRPVGSHAGHGLEKLDSAEGLESYLDRHEGQDFHLCPYVDCSSAQDGRFRKCRIVFIDGVPYPCHLAIADRWDVWYANAGMKDHPGRRAEESAFLDTFDSDFAQRHAAALSALSQSIGLEYFGIDCAEDRNGNLVVFEADNSLIVHDLECPETFPYKGRHMRRIFAAFRALLAKAG